MTQTSRLRSALPLILLLVGVILLVVVVGPGRGGPPLDPRSTGPTGTKALVDSLEVLRVDVRVSSQVSADASVALLLTDTMSDEERDEVRDWVRAGGTLVVSDPTSELTPDPVEQATVAGIAQVPIARACGVTALAGVDEVAPAGGSLVMEVPDTAVGCFPRNEGHWLVLGPEGEGTIVALGGPDVFINARLAASGHAELVGALLVPDDGGSVAFLRPPRPGEGEAGLADLIPGGVRWGLLQLGLAFLVLVAWRARRLGRPIEEPQPVELPGSELVVAVGNLLQQSSSRDDAAALLRRDVRRAIGERLGLPPGTPTEVLAPLVAARSGHSLEEVHRTLDGPTPSSDAELVSLASTLEQLRVAALSPRQKEASPT